MDVYRILSVLAVAANVVIVRTRAMRPERPDGFG
jgi:hypothetical protein